MTTLLNDTVAIEGYLHNTAAPGDALLVEAKAIICPAFAANLQAQGKTYQIVQLYGRKRLKAELETVHQKLFSEPDHHSFAQRIKIFSGADKLNTQNMNIDKNEFRKFAVGNHFAQSLNVDRYIIETETAMLPMAMTPYITEERQLNVAQMDVFSRLMVDRIIFLGKAVDDNIANIIQAQLLFLQSTDTKKDIQLYINSPGGSVYAGLGIYDTMHFISPDVATICTGIALSMAAVLLCGGAAGKRAALNHSRVMLHQPSGGVQGPASDIEISAREILKIREELNTIISKHSGRDYDEVHRASDRDYWMTSPEAKEFGMIDEILGKVSEN